MQTCPNISSREWKQLVSVVGEMEAYRDYMIHDTIRDVASVLFSIRSRSAEENSKIQKASSFIENAIVEMNNDLAGLGLNRLADQISSNLGVSYDTINIEEAYDMLKDAKQKYNGEPAFFFQGQVYFVKDLINKDVILHEFSHPLVRALRTENPELYEKLVEDARNTPGINRILEERYSDQSVEEQNEEAIVRAMEMAEPTSSFWKKALFAIKQLLRKLFGKSVSLGKLSKDTTLAELFTMLQTEQFNIDFVDSSNDNVVSFIREQKSINDYLANEASSPKVEILLEDLRKVVSYGQRLVDNPQVEESIGEFLETEDGRAIFEELRRELNQFKQYNNEVEKYIKKDKPAPKDLASTVVTRNLAVLSNSLAQASTLLENLEAASFKLSKDPNQAELIETQAVLKIAQSVNNWAGSLEALMNENKVPSGNEVRQEVGRIGVMATTIESEIKKVFIDFSVDFLYEENKDINAEVEDFYKTRIAQLEKEKASGKNVDRKLLNLKKKYAEKALTKENLRKVLMGQLGDASYASSMMENFLNNSDPVIGGFASWYRKQAYKAQAKMQEQTNQFIKDVLPVIKAAGYNPNNPQEFFKQLAFLDKTVTLKSSFDEGLESDVYQLEEFEVWSFLNPYKNYLADKKILEEKIERAQSVNDSTTLQDLYQQRDEMNKFFHRRYTKEYYDAYEEYNTPTGKIAREKLDNLYTELSAIDDKINGYRAEDITDEDFIEKKLILRAVRQLYSEVDIYGKKKVGEDLEIAQLLQSVREKTKDFFEFKEVPGLFETAYRNFLTTINDDVEFGSPEFDTLVNDWLEANTQVAVTDDYFDLINDILDEINSIQLEMGLENPLKDLYKTINDITKGFRDSANETEATAITPEAQIKVRDVQQQIINIRNSTAKLNGLTTEESERLTELFTKKNDADVGVTNEELTEIKELLNKKKQQGVDKDLASRLYMLFQQLSELRTTRPTEYYTEAIEAHISRIKSEGTVPGLFGGAFPQLNSLILNTSDVENLMTDSAFINTIMQDKEFSDWFYRNHVAVKGGYERTMIWNVKVPADDSYYQTMILPTGEEIKRIPNRTFQERIVKDNYVSEREVGKTIDVWGNYLPNLEIENNPYRNDQYFKLKKENPSMFKALEALSNWHLSKQDGLNVTARLGYQIPRFRPDTLERGQELTKSGALGVVLEDAKEKVVEVVDDIQSGYSFDRRMLATFGIVDDSLSKIPIHGVVKLESKNVSLNVMDSMIRYNNSAIYQEMLINTSPIAQMLLSVVENTELIDPNKVDRQILKRTGKVVNATIDSKSKHKSIRAMALDAFYEREYLGKVNAETMIDNASPFTKAAYKTFRKGTGIAMRIASTSFFAVNLPSAIKNRFAAVLQNNIEAVAGEVLSSRGFLLGKATAKKAIAQVSSTIYSDKVKGKYVQIGQIFDIDGQLDKQRDPVSRTFARDAVSLSWLFSPRKLLQMDGTLELLYGMLHSKVIELKDGSKITLHDAMEVKDGQLQVRPDTKEDWSLSSDNFVKFRILFQGKMNRLQGTYDQIDQPLFTRYLAGRAMLFLRKYFISMFMNRFASSRIQYDTRKVEEGYYRGAGRFMYNFLTAAKNSATQGGSFAEFDRNTQKEKTAFKRLGADVFQQLVLLIGYKALMQVLFGYDPESDDDDERKTALLRKGSGALPLPGVNSKYDFNPVGFAQLHLINQMMQVHQEAATFSPISISGGAPLAGSVGELFKSPYSAILKPSFERAGTIFSLANQTARGDKGAYYTRDVGPWWFQKQGSNKLTKETLGFIGINGKTVDPANAIVQWQQGQRLRKR